MSSTKSGTADGQTHLISLSSSSFCSISFTLWTTKPSSSSVSSLAVRTILFRPSMAGSAEAGVFKPTVKTPRTSSLYGESGTLPSSGSTSGSSAVDFRAASIKSASSLKVGARFGSSSALWNSLTRCGTALASVKRATDAWKRVSFAICELIEGDPYELST